MRATQSKVMSQKNQNSKRVAAPTLLDESTGEQIVKSVRSWLNYAWKKSTKEMGIDQTIPDQTMSLREIVTKHSHGMEINGMKTAIFDENAAAQGINIMTLDLVDLQELKILNNEEITRLKNLASAEKLDRQQKADSARTQLQDEAAEKAFRKFQEEHPIDKRRTPSGFKTTQTEV